MRSLCLAIDHLHHLHRVDTDRDGWVQMNYEDFMKVRGQPEFERVA